MFLIIIIGLIGFGLYELATTVYTVPNRQTKKAVKRLVNQKKLSDDLKEFFVDPISKVILKFIKMDRKSARIKLSIVPARSIVRGVLFFETLPFKPSSLECVLFLPMSVATT